MNRERVRVDVRTDHRSISRRHSDTLTLVLDMMGWLTGIRFATSLWIVYALAAVGKAVLSPHEHTVYPGMPHGFLQMEFLPPAREAIGRAIAFLDRHVRA